MTNCVAIYQPDTRVYVLGLRGHATGSERVCAAISGLVYALAGFLANDEDTEMLAQWMEPGDVSLQFICGERGKAALQLVLIGLMQIEKAHPDYIKTKISEEIF